jgi:hypothetical protein
MDHDRPTYTSHCSWDHKCMPPWLACLLRWALNNFLPRLALNHNPLIPVSWVAGIIAICNYSQQELFNETFFWWNLGLNSGLHTCKAGILPLKPHLQPPLN